METLQRVASHANYDTYWSPWYTSFKTDLRIITPYSPYVNFHLDLSKLPRPSTNKREEIVVRLHHVELQVPSLNYKSPSSTPPSDHHYLHSTPATSAFAPTPPARHVFRDHHQRDDQHFRYHCRLPDAQLQRAGLERPSRRLRKSPRESGRCHLWNHHWNASTHVRLHHRSMHLYLLCQEANYGED